MYGTIKIMSKPKQKKTRKNKAYLYKSSDASFIEPPQTTTIYAKLAHIGGILVFLWIGWHAVKWIGGELYEWHLRDAYSRIEIFNNIEFCANSRIIFEGNLKKDIVPPDIEKRAYITFNTLTTGDYKVYECLRMVSSTAKEVKDFYEQQLRIYE